LEDQVRELPSVIDGEVSESRVTGLDPPEGRVPPAKVEQFVVGAALGDATVLEDEDLVGVPHSR